MNTRRSRWLFPYALLLAATTSAADELRLEGFLSQGYIHTSDNRFYGPSDSGSFELQEAGLSLSNELTPRLRVAAQVIYRRAGSVQPGDVSFDYALADLSVIEAESMALGLQVGRVKLPMGLLNETRNVPQTRPGVLMPLSVYYEYLREAATTTDGGRLDLDYRFANATLELTAFGGTRRNPNQEIEYLVLAQDTPGSFPEFDSQGYRIALTALDERLRLGFSSLDVIVDYRPFAAFDPVAAGKIDARYWVASVEWQDAHWYATAEYSRFKGRLLDFGPMIPEDPFEGEGYFLQGGVRVLPKLEVFGRREIQYQDLSDRTGERRFLPFFGAAHIAYGKSWVLGTRYDLSPNLMLRGEYHWVDGTAFLPRSENPNFPAQVRRWEMLALSVSYRF